MNYLSKINVKCILLIFCLAEVFNYSQAKATAYADTIANPKPNLLQPTKIFSSSLEKPTVVGMTLTGDFAEAKEKAGGGNWTGEERPMADFGVPMIFSNIGMQAGSATQVKALGRVRGMSSADEATFPKLKIEIDQSANTQGTIFELTHGFRINTSGFNNNPTAPFREALAYDIASTLGLVTPKYQRALIKYQQEIPNGKVKLISEKQALIIENNGPLLERLKMTDVSVSYFDNEVEIDMQQAALLFVFNTLISNADVNISVHNEPKMGTEKFRVVFNTSLLQSKPGEKAIPLVYDLDKSDAVAVYKTDEKLESRFFNQQMTYTEAKLMFSLFVLRQRFSLDELNYALDIVLKKLPSISVLIKGRVADGLVDQKAANRIQETMTYFEKWAKKFQEVQVTLGESQIYSEPKLDETLSLLYYESPNQSFLLRPGTPVKVLGKTEDGKFFKVLIMDVRYEINSPLVKKANEKYHDYLGYMSVDTLLGPVIESKNLGYVNEIDMTWF